MWLAKQGEISVESNGCGCATRIGIRRAFMDKVKNPIMSFQDLDVYQSTYKETQPSDGRRNEQRNPGPDLAYNLNGLIKAHSAS